MKLKAFNIFPVFLLMVLGSQNPVAAQTSNYDTTGHNFDGVND
jgi:hypothetical protein